MAVEIVMPRLGWTMEEGVLAEWIRQDGDLVKPGDILFTVESDKALQEVEAFDSGILRIPPDSPAVGSTIPVGGRLAYLVQPGEALPFEPHANAGAAPTAPASGALADAASTVVPSQPVVARSGVANGNLPTISPRARRVALELGVDWTALKGSGRTGRIVERDVRAAAEKAPDDQPVTTQPVTTQPVAAHPVAQPAALIDISPVARRAADELGVDLAALAARHPERRITREDVERAASAATRAPTPAAEPDSTRAPISRTRRLIADRMSASARATAPVTLTTEADATELVTLRRQLKASGREPIPSYNDLLAKLCAAALEEHPALNARLDGDDIVQFAAVHVGIAVDTPRGLLVPVIRDVQAKNLRQIARESAELIQAARDGSIRAGDLSGSTFSITNLGMYDIDAFTPIINLPECAILGVGRIVPKQVVMDADAGEVAIRHMMFLSLTFDHRLVDGGPAARFVRRVKQFVEQPYLWLGG